MSIVGLKKVTFLAPVEQKERVLEDLQGLGCLHLIPLTSDGERADESAGPSRQARDALKFLASCSYQRRQITDADKFDPVAVEEQALKLEKRLYDLREERDYLAERLTNLERWGDFAFASLDDMEGLRLWFYVIPRREIQAFEEVTQPWEIVNEDERDYYVIVISAEEPADIPFDRTLTGWRSPADLARKLEETEVAIEDAEAERAGLTRWCTLFARSLDGLEDYAARRYAARQTFDDAPLFAIQAWAPDSRMEELLGYADDRGLAVEYMDPGPDDQPPTLFDNPPRLRAGEDLVTFYQTPAYRLWDPSSVVFFSFALFFAMIMSDAGYGLVLAGITAWLWKRMGTTERRRQWRVLLATLSGTTIVYGVLAGGYFGVTPP
ncbi:MAG: ATPase V, partial [Myxococcota bacterium]